MTGVQTGVLWCCSPALASPTECFSSYENVFSKEKVKKSDTYSKKECLSFYKGVSDPV